MYLTPPTEKKPSLAHLTREGWILVTVGVGTFMSALDSSVVNTVLPVIQRSFGSDVSAIEWVVTTYMLVVGGLLLSFGRLGDLRGHKRFYVAGFALFAASSMLCGLAPSARTLIGFRVFQGVGAAMLLANSAAILTRNFPAARRGKVLGLQAGMTYLGLTVGPSLGGWLTGRFGWRSIFFMNVPVGALALGLSQRFIPADVVTARDHRFDLAGSLAWISGLFALLLALNLGHAYGWASPPIQALAGAAAFVLGGFLLIERHVGHPMLDLGLFKRRLFWTSTLSAGLNFVCIYSIIFLMPFYLIQGRGFGPGRAGLLLTVPSLVRAVSSPLFGALSDRIGTRPLSMSGMMLLAVGLVMLARLGGQSSLGEMVAGLAVTGLGAGLFVSPNMSALMGSAPREQQGTAAAVAATARIVGMALGVGLAGALLTTILEGGPKGAATLLFRAVDVGFLVAAGVAVLGVLTTAAGGPGPALPQGPGGVTDRREIASP